MEQMNPKIGSRYLETLEIINQFHNNSSTFHENPELVYIESHNQRCYYDRCPFNKRTAEGMITFQYANGNILGYSFHKSCLVLLSKDPRINCMN